MFDTDAVAKIICYWAKDQPLLIDALADHFEAEDKHPGCTNHGCPWRPEGGMKTNAICKCPRPFIRANWIRIAEGKPDFVDHWEAGCPGKIVGDEHCICS